MKTLTVCQPWAWALIHGPKRIENRSWPTRYRGPLLIHAGKTRNRLGDEEDSLPDLPPYRLLEFGALIGVVELVDCVPVELVVGEPFAEGPWCWLLRNPRAIDPMPMLGKLGLWVVPDEILHAPGLLTSASA